MWNWNTPYCQMQVWKIKHCTSGAAVPPPPLTHLALTDNACCCCADGKRLGPGLRGRIARGQRSGGYRCVPCGCFLSVGLGQHPVAGWGNEGQHMGVDACTNTMLAFSPHTVHLSIFTPAHPSLLLLVRKIQAAAAACGALRMMHVMVARS